MEKGENAQLRLGPPWTPHPAPCRAAWQSRSPALPQSVFRVGDSNPLGTARSINQRRNAGCRQGACALQEEGPLVGVRSGQPPPTGAVGTRPLPSRRMTAAGTGASGRRPALSQHEADEEVMDGRTRWRCVVGKGELTAERTAECTAECTAERTAEHTAERTAERTAEGLGIRAG